MTITKEEVQKLLVDYEAKLLVGTKSLKDAAPDLAIFALAESARADQAEAAMTAVVERAENRLSDLIFWTGDDDNGTTLVSLREAKAALRALAPASGLAMLAELRVEARENAMQALASMGQAQEAYEAQLEAEAELARVMAREAGPTFYIDCEFDGHNGPLLSIAIVREDGANVYVTAGAVAEDPWVIANVLPWINCHDATDTWHVRPLEVGTVLRNFIGLCKHPVIIADSPVDIARFCQAISTGEDGGWASADFPGMTFEVRNVDCYPTALEGAVQHNAWWDAMALRAAIRENKQ